MKRDISKLSLVGAEMFIPIYVHLLSSQDTSLAALQKVGKRKTIK